MGTIAQILPTDKIILVMGPTGSGKSTFINYASGGVTCEVGDGLLPCTNKVSITRARFQPDRSNVITTNSTTVPKAVIDPPNDVTPGSNEVDEPMESFTACFIDTPGFTNTSNKDTDTSDVEILSTIATFVEAIKGRGLGLDAILYMHRITDNRVEGSPLKRLRLLADICGGIELPIVVLVTTMWSLLPDKGIGQGRQAELERNFWESMRPEGCRVTDFDETHDSAQEAVFGQKGSLKAVVLFRDLVSDPKETQQTAPKETDLTEAEPRETERKETVPQEKETRSGFDEKLRQLHEKKRDLVKRRKELKKTSKALRKLQSDKGVQFDAELRQTQDSIAEVRAQIKELNPALPAFMKRILGKPDAHPWHEVSAPNARDRLPNFPTSAMNIIEQILPTDKIILVMGPTGSGKSTFINLASEGDPCEVGNGIFPCTKEVTITRVRFEPDRSGVLAADGSKPASMSDGPRIKRPNDQPIGGANILSHQRFASPSNLARSGTTTPDSTDTDEPTESFTACFVDTPGLNDSLNGDIERADIDILDKIGTCLHAIQRKDLQVDAILYLHRITDNRMAGSPLRRLQLLLSMHGDMKVPLIVLVTTMWSLLPDKQIGKNRQAELEQDFWASMKPDGGRVTGFDEAHDLAYEVVFGQRGSLKAVVLSRDLFVSQKETDSGTTRDERLKQLREEERKLEEERKRLAESLNALRGISRKSSKKLQADLQKTNDSLREVKAKIKEMSNSSLPAFMKRIFKPV
ncbi:hypothetical protein FRC17_009232 [Serendipita sp. 399]|nr:hypothetical protein FRC17_009232 [Serendipita sp. 399]